MKHNVNCRFTFQNVGQGLFYTGTIDRFNFVYDCGSENDVFRDLAISSYLDMELVEKRIDLLVISHFHGDHINGLETLLRKVGVHTVIVPYFDPLERLILSLRRPNEDNWYYEFLTEPIPFLFRNGAKRVIIVGGSKGEERRTFSSDELPPFPLEESKRTEEEDPLYIRMPEDDDLGKIVAKEEPSWKNSGLILTKKHEGFIAPKAIGKWIFRFFNYKVEEKRLRSFRKCLVSKKIDPQNNASIKAAITNANTRAILAKCYTKLRKDLNSTSLALYHGPVGKYEATFQTANLCELERASSPCWLLYPFAPRCWFARSDSLGCLLTGDLSLNYAKKHLELIKHYRNQFQDISICQVPHHGAEGNWNNQLLRRAQNCSLWIASSGFSNIYGHPSINVVLSVLNAMRFFMHNCEFNKVILEGIVQWRLL